MNHLNPSSLLRRGWVLSLLALGSFGLCPVAQAVEPAAPDTALAGGNTADGQNALLSLTTGTFNSAFGFDSVLLISTASFDTGIGAGALLLDTAGTNTAVGAGALLSNSTGSDNNAVGAFALFNNVGGFFNNALGRNVLLNSDGDQNNAVGDDAMFSNTTGSFNTAVGDDALDGCIDGNSNIAIGDEAGTAIVHGSNIIMIGLSAVSSAFGEADNTTYINHIFGEPVGVGPGQAVFVDSDGVLGFTTSSRRVKHGIKPMDKSSEALFALKPVTFKYNNDKSDMTCFGLIAEDVAEVNPELVLRDKEGEVSSVRYEQINSMLLNEFLKEHKKVQNLEVTVTQQQKGMEVLTAQLKEQAAQIQKVSAELEVSKPAPQTVLNNQ